MSTKSIDVQLASLSHHDWTLLRSAWARPASWWIAKHFNPKTGKLTKRWVIALPSVTLPPFNTMTEAYTTVSVAVCAESNRRMEQSS